MKKSTINQQSIFIVGIAAIFHANIFTILCPLSLLSLYDGALLASLFSWPVDIVLHHWHWLHTCCGARACYDVTRFLELFVVVELFSRLVCHRCIHLSKCIIGTYLIGLTFPFTEPRECEICFCFPFIEFIMVI